MLSNGRLFRYLSLAREVASIGHPDLMIGIPLYSDVAHRHDHVVQADGAFDQTIRGLMNLARCGVPVEVRVVLHRQTVDRLPQLARFIARNLPFVDHVALMGLEMMGFVRMNLEALWVDPADYQVAAPSRRSGHLLRHGMHASIYNHQLCVLDRELWPIARKSISDWKNEYLEECDRVRRPRRLRGLLRLVIAAKAFGAHPIRSSSGDDSRSIRRPTVDVPFLQPLKAIPTMWTSDRHSRPSTDAPGHPAVRRSATSSST